MIGILSVPIIIFLAYRLLPESSPIARAKTFVENRNCLECHVYSPPRSLPSANSDSVQHPKYNASAQDLETYFEAIRINIESEKRIVQYSNELTQGEKLARDYHCFICHGLLGQGGQENKGSLKGYIPGWYGRDFDILTNNGNPNAIREWITKGMYQDLINEPVLGSIAEHYFEKQEINMLRLPSLPEEEIQRLVKYVLMIRSYGAMDKAAVITYEEASKKTQ